jgi:queuine/archaeosine tRNA-ribosyltransferase
MSNEMLGMIILSIYNIWFMNMFFEEIRISINENKFEEYKSSILSNLVK